MERRLSDFFTQEIAEKAGLAGKKGEANPVITGLQFDSRKVMPGNLFFALPGLHTNGRLFIDKAISAGAAAIVYEGDDIILQPCQHDSRQYCQNQAILLRVNNSRFAMSPIAAAFYNFPSRRMHVIGVTGTEGKSTTVYLIWQLLALLGKKTGFFSTVQHCLGNEVLENSEHQTTPEAVIVQQLLCEMADNGCEYAVVEASSHGLSRRTNRLGDVEFCAAVMTNVTHEHLEFHGTWEQYRCDKANLFRALDSYAQSRNKQQHDNGHNQGVVGSEKKLYTFEPFGVINADDKSASFFAEAAKNKTFMHSAEGRDANIILETIESCAQGNKYTVFLPALNERLELKDNLPGAFNSGNVMAALLTVSGLLGLPVRNIAPFVNSLKPVRGRMNSINKGQLFELVVDYAHTPSSFQAIFPPLRKRLNKTGGRIISLFGSGGERDTQKRPEQGKIAAEYSDIIIVTDEDPRCENPMSILEDIAAGAEQHGKTANKPFVRGENLFLITDRPSAIRKALSLACPGDLVLLLGKGHENSIIHADYVMPYDEITEAEKALEELV